MKFLCENDNIKQHLEYLKQHGYRYIVKCKDKFLSGWGKGRDSHVQLIACTTDKERDYIIKDLMHDYTMSYIDWYYIEDSKSIYNAIYNKSYTIRNDWTRAFKNNEEKDNYLKRHELVNTCEELKKEGY